MGKRCFKYFKTSFLENENLICMYISYWGNLNLHIDVHEIIFSSPSSFGKYFCSSCIFMLRFNLSYSLSPIANLLVFSSMAHSFLRFSFANGLRGLSDIKVFLAFYSWFILSFSSHLSSAYSCRCALHIYIVFITHLYPLVIVHTYPLI